jgi:hypothetical protein
VAENQHSQYVNKRLSSVKPLLAQTKLEGASSTGFYPSACVDAAVLQLYFAVFHYVNELLVMYQRPAIENNTWQLADVITQHSEDVAELNEWKQLLQLPDSFLSLLCKYPDHMLAAHKEARLTQATTTSGSQAISLIDISVDDSEIYLTEKNVHWVMDECYQLIQRQREHLIEC